MPKHETSLLQNLRPQYHYPLQGSGRRRGEARPPYRSESARERRRLRRVPRVDGMSFKAFMRARANGEV